MLKLNLTWWGKLNQWKIWKTEPTENLYQSLCTFKCREVITHECPCINVLSIETSSYLNVETEPRTKWCCDGETKPTENFHLGNKISTSAIMKKSKNGCHFVNMHHMEKFQITDPCPPKKIWVSGFLSVNGNRISCQPLWKNCKMAAIS